MESVVNASVSAITQLPESMRGLSFQNGIAIRPDPDFDMDMQRLIRGIKAGIRKTKKIRRIYAGKKMKKARTVAKSKVKLRIK